MKVSCPACDSKYTIADDKVTGRKVKVRCKSCGGQIVVDGTAPTPNESSNNPTGDADDNDATRVFTSAERNAFDAEHGDATVAEPLPASDTTAADEPSSGLIWSVNVSETDERSLTTAEVVTAYLAGEFEGEVYVWHDGLADWSLIPNVPELAKAIADEQSKRGSKPVASKPSAKSSPTASAATPSPAVTQPKKALPTTAKGPGATVTKAVATKDAPKTAARASTAKRPQSAHDIFAAANQGSEDVDISVSQDEEEQKKTGARNESSVLFSLDALKAGIVSSPQPTAAKAGPGRKGPPVAPKKKLEDLMSNAAPMPHTGGPVTSPLMMSSAQALLTAPAPLPPKPEPKPVVLSDVPPAAGAVPAATTAVAPQKKKGKIIALAAIVGAVAIAGLAIALSGGSKTEKTVASASAVESAVKAVATPEPVKTPEPTPAETKPAESAVAAASAAPSATAGAVAGAGAAKGGGAVAVAKKDEKKDTKKEEKKAEPAGPVSTGLSSFNKGAAIQALNVAASQATICKKPDGPTGTGKVTVTFAPSGRATTAVVSGGSFGGTTVGGCISGVFKRAKVPPFDGDPVTVSKSFTITL